MPFIPAVELANCAMCNLGALEDGDEFEIDNEVNAQILLSPCVFEHDPAQAFLAIYLSQLITTEVPDYETLVKVLSDTERLVTNNHWWVGALEHLIELHPSHEKFIREFVYVFFEKIYSVIKSEEGVNSHN